MTTPANHLARITNDDIEWWLERIRELDWTFAFTYAERETHEYVTARRNAGPLQK